MRKDKEEAINLRKMGKSYSEIKEELSVPKSTLSDWFRDQKWSNDIAKVCADKYTESSKIRLRNLNKIRGDHLRRAYKEAESEAIEDYEKLKFHPLFVAGLMIYWGEGNKNSKYRISIANTDPQMILLFKSFLERICGIYDHKTWLLLYPDLDENICKRYWKDTIMIKDEHFTKSIVIKGKSPTKRLLYGVCNIGITSAYLKRKIHVWFNLLSKDIVKESY